MRTKARRLSALLAAALLAALCACGPVAVWEAPAGEAQADSEPAPPEEESQEPEEPVEEPENHDDYTGSYEPADLATDTSGNISFSYYKHFTTNEIDGIKYIHYSDTAFFYTDSIALELDGDVFDAEDANDYFTAALESFIEGGWFNAEMVMDASLLAYSWLALYELEIWVCIVEMEHVSMGEFTAVPIVLYLDGVLTSFTLITDNRAYEAALAEFSETLLSLQPAGDSRGEPMIGGGYV